MRLPKWLRRLSGAKGSETGESQSGLLDEQFMKLLENQPSVADLPRLTLDEYRAFVRQLPPPSKEQIAAFAHHVSGAKSWYKHLPLRPPGVPFLFFIDPCAGLDRVVDQEGRATFLQRTDETPQFHYTWMTTDDYRSKYGRLAFACDAGTQMFLPVSAQLQDGREVSGSLANSSSRATVNLTEEREFQIPQEVVDAGTVKLTGVIHRMTSVPWPWAPYVKDDAETFRWPEETGGADTVAKIFELCRSIADEVERADSPDKRAKLEEADEELERLLAPERERQRAEIIAATQAVVDLVYGELG